jgi:predicted CXXCH cytochrome family protein
VLFAGGVLLASSPALADGGPHVSNVGTLSLGSTIDGCAGCHRLHSSQQGQYLLTQSSEEVLCLTCHNGGLGATTDVTNGVQYTTATGTKVVSGALRGGGFNLARLGASEATRAYSASGSIDKSVNNIPVGASEAVTSSHAVGAPATMWGAGAFSGTANPGTTVTLECADCHDPHGNGNFRILRPYGALGTNWNAAGVGVTALTGTYTSTVAHGLVAGQKVSIQGSSTAGVNVNSTTVATVPTALTFTLAAPGADGTGTVVSAPQVTQIVVTDDATNTTNTVASPCVVNTGKGCKSIYTVTLSQAMGLVPGEWVGFSGLTALFGGSLPTNGIIGQANISSVSADGLTITIPNQQVTSSARQAAGTYTVAAPANTAASLGFSSSIKSVVGNATTGAVYTTWQGHGLAVGQKVTVTGITPASLNVTKGVITAVGGTTAATATTNAISTTFTIGAITATDTYVSGGAISGIPDTTTYDAAGTTVLTNVKTYTSTNYWRADDHSYPGQTPSVLVPAGSTAIGTSAFIADTNQWCTTCHSRYLAGNSTSRKFTSGDAVFTYRHTTGAVKEDSPTCLQCHVAHGTNAVANGQFSSAVTSPSNATNSYGTTGDSKLLRVDNRGVCVLCHNY